MERLGLVKDNWKSFSKAGVINIMYHESAEGCWKRK